jgi:CHAD domain-containing protein
MVRIRGEMSYCLEHDESIGRGIRRVVRDQIKSAIKEIDDDDMSRNEAVHEVRKHCKKIRGALRLVRGSFEDYRSENIRYRDLARELSVIRDARILRDIQRELAGEIADRTSRAGIAALDEALESHAGHGSKNVRDALGTVREGLMAANDEAGKWDITGDGFEAIAGGLRKSYKRARNGLRRCRNNASTDNLHDWRKRAKYHWYHLRLLSDIWPKVINARSVAGHHLSGLLGDDHDLAGYIDVLDSMNDDVPAAVATALRQHVDKRREALQQESLAIGARLFAEKPKRFVERFETYWDAWQGQDLVEVL